MSYRPNSSSVSSSSPFADAETTIRGLSQDFCTAFNTGNYDQAASLFTPDGIFMAPNVDAVQGPKAVERLLRQFGESGCEDLRLETSRVEYSGDLALEIGRYTMAVHLPNGTTFADRGKFLHAWRRLGVWLMVANSWNSNLPSPQ
jgi:uncharacterized protein (TIGR02246 family)